MSLDDLIGGPQRTSGTNVARGMVNRPPLSATSELTVVLINYASSLEHRVPASNWMPRGTTLPVKGDRCLVAFDDDGDAWVPAWDGLSDFGPGDQALLAPGAAVNASRALGTSYRPSTTRPVLVVATVFMVCANARAYVYAKCGATTPAVPIVGRELHYVYGVDQVSTYRTITFLVPTGHYYMLEGVVTLGSPTIGIDRVLEQAL